MGKLFAVVCRNFRELQMIKQPIYYPIPYYPYPVPYPQPYPSLIYTTSGLSGNTTYEAS
jgi:hypothetical protein